MNRDCVQNWFSHLLAIGAYSRNLKNPKQPSPGMYLCVHTSTGKSGSLLQGRTTEDNNHGTFTRLWHIDPHLYYADRSRPAFCYTIIIYGVYMAKQNGRRAPSLSCTLHDECYYYGCRRRDFLHYRRSYFNPTRRWPTHLAREKFIFVNLLRNHTNEIIPARNAVAPPNDDGHTCKQKAQN